MVRKIVLPLTMRDGGKVSPLLHSTYQPAVQNSAFQDWSYLTPNPALA